MSVSAPRNALALAAVAAAMLAFSAPAEARKGRNAALIAGGVVGAVAVGALLGATRPARAAPVEVIEDAPPPRRVVREVEVVRECRYAVRRVWLDSETYQDRRVRICE